MNGRDTQGERRWRWTLRAVGITTLIWSAVIYTITQEIPAIFPIIAGGAIGLEGLQGIEIRRRRGNDR